MDVRRFAALTRLYSLSSEQLGQIAPLASELRVAAGRRLLLDGPFAHELVFVVGGRALVRSAGETVGGLGPGDAFGELVPWPSASATASVTALTGLQLLVFSSRDMRRLRDLAPDTFATLLATCAVAPAERAAAHAGLTIVHAVAA
jgi:CRP-like cAMP-binding protein